VWDRRPATRITVGHVARSACCTTSTNQLAGTVYMLQLPKYGSMLYKSLLQPASRAAVEQTACTVTWHARHAGTRASRRQPTGTPLVNSIRLLCGNFCMFFRSRGVYHVPAVRDSSGPLLLAV
jgi:hypothetical protein